jgi:hypothetical protein
MRGWWNCGVHPKSLSTYCFLVKCSVPTCLDSLVLKEWKANIYEMLKSIPYILPENSDAYFDSIDSRLSDYELYQEDAPMLLELAIWKTKITHQSSQNAADMRLHSRADSLSMVTIIVRNVLSYL